MIEWILGACIAAIVVVFGWAIYDECVSEKFYLRKDEWTCEKNRTETDWVPMFNGKTTIMMPQTRTVCLEYVRR